MLLSGYAELHSTIFNCVSGTNFPCCGADGFSSLTSLLGRGQAPSKNQDSAVHLFLPVGGNIRPDKSHSFHQAEQIHSFLETSSRLVPLITGSSSRCGSASADGGGLRFLLPHPAQFLVVSFRPCPGIRLPVRHGQARCDNPSHCFTKIAS